MADMISNVCCESPIIQAILKQISQRHRSMGEAMNKNSFQQSLCIMQAVANSSNVSGQGNGAVGGCSIKDPWALIDP